MGVLERKLKIFIYARIVVSLLLLVSTLLLGRQEPVETAASVFQSGMVKLMAISFVFSVVSLLVAKKPRFNQTTIYLQVIWDLLFVTVLLLFTDGIASPYSFLYLLSIMNAGVLLGRREALYTASLCAILFGAIVDFQYFGLLEPIGLSQVDAYQTGEARIFYTIFLNLLGFVLTAFITGYLAERARVSEAALHEKNIDLQELTRLNATIVSRIDIGLVTTNRHGVIRVFNPKAQELTGVRQKTACGMRLDELFPSLQDEALDAVHNSGEFKYVHPAGQVLVFSYNAASFTDAEDENSGKLVSFQDLTQIRRMEQQLKRIDRLAALGELSARMAHEIRNPLASMSGSVQLLMDHGGTSSSDRRLLEIVVRETDRLNVLISEFLQYARPALPAVERLELRPLLEELKLLLTSDSRFSGIAISNLVPGHMLIQADAGQLRQVLMNLFINSAEAIGGVGTIEVEAQFLLNGADGFENSPAAVIRVTDTGPGIDPETASHLFEPFWSSKPHGTGLGLAISYRIIEAHGGVITAESPASGGSRFSIMLPVRQL